MGLARSIRAKSVYSRINIIQRSHPESIRSYSSALFKRMAPTRFISFSASIDVARFELDSAAAIQKNIEKQEVTPVSRVLVTS